MTNKTITKEQARRFLLAHHCLLPPHTLTGKEGVLQYIDHVGCIQFDPLNKVGRNPELVLQSRVGDFIPGLLEELLYGDRQLLDGWDKMMAIYSVADWPNFRRRRESTREWKRHNQPEVLEILPQVRQEIERRGPLSSIDLDFNQSVDWSWAPTRLARAALESLYNWGELVVHHKVNTRKYYDLASRHIPGELFNEPDPFDNDEAYHDWLVSRRIGGVGLMPGRASDGWLGIWELNSQQRTAAMDRLLAAGRICQVKVEGLKYTLYVREGDLPALKNTLKKKRTKPRAAFLAPLDNLIWDRKLISELFDFEYRWEVYKPAVERRWGYYVLPVLYGERFVARFEPLRDKEANAMLIKNWWWESDIERTNELETALSESLQRFIAYLGVSQVQVDPHVLEREHLEWMTL